MTTNIDNNYKPDNQELAACGGKFLTNSQRNLLQQSLQENLPNAYQQRIQIMLLADEGKSQREICKILGCSLTTTRHWVHIAGIGMAHQWQKCPVGRPKVINDSYVARLQELLKNSPREYGYGFRRWTINWLIKHLSKEFELEFSERHIKRLLKQMGLSTVSKSHKESTYSTYSTYNDVEIEQKFSPI